VKEDSCKYVIVFDLAHGSDAMIIIITLTAHLSKCVMERGLICEPDFEDS
jgi:hypothetical protein